MAINVNKMTFNQDVTFMKNAEVMGSFSVKSFSMIAYKEDGKTYTLADYIDSRIDPIEEKLGTFVDLTTNGQYITGSKYFKNALRFYPKGTGNSKVYTYVGDIGDSQLRLESHFSDGTGCWLNLVKNIGSFRFYIKSDTSYYDISLPNAEQLQYRYGYAIDTIMTKFTENNPVNLPMSLTTAQQYVSDMALRKADDHCLVLMTIVNGSDRYAASVILAPYSDGNVITPFVVMYGTTSDDVATCTGFIDSNRKIHINLDNAVLSEGYSVSFKYLEYNAFYS